MKAVLVLVACLLAVQAAWALTQSNPNEGHKGLAMNPGKFERIFIIQFENQPFMFVKDDPNFQKYTKMGVHLTNYYGVTHPSQPNYWCQVAGDHWMVFSDGVYNWNKTTVVDLMEARGVSWKSYQEDLPYECYAGAHKGPYYRKHNPFISFDNIRNNPTRCAKVVNAKELDNDLAAGTLAQYSYYTPNINNDGHDTGLAFAGKFLDSFFAPRLSKFPAGTLILITWDEDDYLDNNHISSVAIGSMVVPGTTDNTLYNHFSLLRTVEDNWSLGNLGRYDTTANAFQFLN
jgi:hypothetical protein